MSVFNIITLFGGLAMFLYGMRMMGDGLKESSSGALRRIMERVTGTPFKAFLLDVGLLAALSNLSAKTLLEGSQVFEEFKGSLTEQFVQQELVTYFGQPPFYWSSEKSHNEIDFLLETPEAVIPLEVKAGRNVKAKSLRSYCEKYRPPCAVRSSLVRHCRQMLALTDGGSYELLDLPLYALCQLKRELNL